MTNEQIRLGEMRAYGFILLDYIQQNPIHDIGMLNFGGHALTQQELEMALEYLHACGIYLGETRHAKQ